MLERLPLELVPRIIQYLDSFSIYSLLQAFPFIARHCVILLAHNRGKGCANARFSTIPCFFRRGIRFIRVEDFDPAEHRFLMKIYEAYPELSDSTQGLASLQEHLPYVSKTDSYVHCYLRVRPQSGPYPSGIEELSFESLLRREGIPFQTDLCRRHELNDVHINTVAALSPSRVKEAMEVMKLILRPKDYITVRSITISGLDVIENVNFGGFEVSISFIFGKSPKRPILRNVSTTGLYSSLESLSVHYYDHLPIIENCHFDTFHTTVVIAHIPALEGSLTEPLPVHPSPLEHTDCFASLVSIPARHPDSFCELMVIGGHDAILSHFDCTKIRNITWKQSSLQTSFVDTLIAPQLRGFTFETMLMNARLPTIVTTRQEPGNSFNPLRTAITAHHGLIIDRLPIEHDLNFFFIHCLHGNEPGCVVPFIEDISVLSSTHRFAVVSLIGLRTRGEFDVEAFKRRHAVHSDGITPVRGRPSINDLILVEADQE